MEVMRVHVNLTGFHEVASGKGTIRMLPFDGTVDGPYFKGTILSGAADTQKADPDGNGSLSARYVIEGEDFEGNPCKMFIENNAPFNAPTVPDIITDSPALKWLETAKLQGRLEFPDGKIEIVIEALEEEDSL